ncbi:hypothetical protein HII31_06042 [Pseudocercospora fuligena]|uniref:Uncharacterized protein n=1 Tax=Pseudocercospora fuligena TaxID=685502 RepID=A0A8H6RM61_9PEZI|nr:hypothetical protein HII31_06042 [Pseudocercospora fuligena]
MMDAPLYLNVDPGSEGPDVVYIDKPHLDLLRKFYSRSVYTIGTADSVAIYRNVMTVMAAKFSFLLHSVLRFTLMHDRFLYDPIETKASTAESFHAYHAAALFSKALAKPEHSNDEKDALWATCALLGASAFADIEATSAQESWPLKTPELTDLDWLKMSDGKKQVWKLVNPLRENSAFRPAIDFEMKKSDAVYRRALDPTLDQLFPYVTKIYNLDTPKIVGYPTDPYRTAASIIERLLPIEPTYSTVMWFLSFIGHMDPEYRELLEANDPAAMVLLSWWYAKFIPYNAWWITRRALFECQAICLYLDEKLSADHELRRLLEFPKSVCFTERLNGKKQEGGGNVWPWQRNF